jgi:hypothetical protein
MPCRSLCVLVLTTVAAAPAAAQSVLPRFKDQVIDPAVGVVYAMAVADINADGKPDIICVTEQPDQVVWFENPTWKKRAVVEKQPRLPVCIQPFDVDGDGKVELILGADWQPPNTATGGTVWLLKRPDNLDQPWTPIKLDEEPNMHRMRLIDVDGKTELVCSPLQGRGTKGPGWLGNGAVQFILRRPADPFKDRWVREVICDDLHVVHNCWPIDWDGDGRHEMLAASFEGVFLYKRVALGKWDKTQLAEGNQQTKPNRGSSEIKPGRLPAGKRFLATTEPWHGHQAVVYTEPAAPGKLWNRHVLVENHKGGHAVWTADLTGTGVDSLVVGFRGPPEGKAGEWVVYVFHPIDAAAGKWEKLVLDDKGMGSEDVVCADLNGDGRIDVVAGGRGTRNVKVYWNQGK